MKTSLEKGWPQTSVGDVLEKSSYDWALHLSNMVSWKQMFKLCFRKQTERSYFQLLFTGNATHLIYLGYFSCCFSVVIIQQTHCCCLHPNTRSTFMDRSERHWALWKHANLQLKVKVQHFLLWLFSRRKWFRQEVGKDDFKKIIYRIFYKTDLVLHFNSCQGYRIKNTQTLMCRLSLFDFHLVAKLNPRICSAGRN